ncbi:Hypothetical predicted protein, partial [Olea europaea subsp. europaea]
MWHLGGETDDSESGIFFGSRDNSRHFLRFEGQMGNLKSSLSAELSGRKDEEKVKVSKTLIWDGDVLEEEIALPVLD